MQFDAMWQQPKRMGTLRREITGSIGNNIIGFDVHPVAVTLARVALYLLAIGRHHLKSSRTTTFYGSCVPPATRFTRVKRLACSRKISASSLT